MDGLGMTRRDEQRDDRAVGVPHEVGPLADQLGDVMGIDIKVSSAGGSARAVAAAVGEYQRAGVGEGTWRATGERSPGQAAVDADDAVAVAPYDDVERTGRSSARRAERPRHRAWWLGHRVSQSTSEVALAMRRAIPSVPSTQRP